MNEDKRRSPRMPLDVRVNCAFDAIAHSKDISEGGICLITDAALEANRILSLSFLLPRREAPIKCFGKVMWSRRATEHLYENGVSFWDIKDRDRAEISSYLRSAIGAP